MYKVIFDQHTYPALFAAYVLGPAFGGILAGCFHLAHKKAIHEMKKHDWDSFILCIKSNNNYK